MSNSEVLREITLLLGVSQIKKSIIQLVRSIKKAIIITLFSNNTLLTITRYFPHSPSLSNTPFKRPFNYITTFSSLPPFTSRASIFLTLIITLSQLSIRSRIIQLLIVTIIIILLANNIIVFQESYISKAYISIGLIKGISYINPFILD